MKLDLVKTTYDQLPGGSRCLLALTNKPFFFVFNSGRLYMNESLGDGIVPALETMWKNDFVENDEVSAEIDWAYDQIKELAGEAAASQATSAWLDAAKKSRKEKATVAAQAWVKEEMAQLTDGDWDLMYDSGLDKEFLLTGLSNAYRRLANENPKSPEYRDWLKNWALASFVYGFQMGRKNR